MRSRHSVAGILLMILGIAMMGAAGWLVIQNMNEDRAAGTQSQAALEQLLTAIETRQAGALSAAPVEAMYSDGTLYVPVGTEVTEVDGAKYAVIQGITRVDDGAVYIMLADALYVPVPGKTYVGEDGRVYLALDSAEAGGAGEDGIFVGVDGNLFLPVPAEGLRGRRLEGEGLAETWESAAEDVASFAEWIRCPRDEMAERLSMLAVYGLDADGEGLTILDQERAPNEQDAWYGQSGGGQSSGRSSGGGSSSQSGKSGKTGPTATPRPTPTAGAKVTAAPTVTPVATPAPTVSLRDRELPVKKINGKKYCGYISIPSINIKLPVLNSWSYANLKVSPCRYRGTPYRGNMTILAHNYNQHFGKIKTLSAGSAVTFTDMDGNVFKYEVAEVETAGPKSVNYIVYSDYPLTLFTCTIGGRQRVVVRCVPAG